MFKIVDHLLAVRSSDELGNLPYRKMAIARLVFARIWYKFKYLLEFSSFIRYTPDTQIVKGLVITFLLIKLFIDNGCEQCNDFIIVQTCHIIINV